MDLLPTPALLVEAAGDRILLANAGVAGLTAFTRDEIQRESISALFPGLDRRSLIGKLASEGAGEGAQGAGRVAARGAGESLAQDHLTQEIRASLARRKGPALEVILTPTPLDAQKKWLLLALEPLQARRQRQAGAQRQAGLLEALGTLALAFQADGLDAALAHALQAGSALTGANLLATYTGAGAEAQWKRYAGHGPAELVPDEIPAGEILPLSRPALWVPGKRALSRLQRAARQSGLAYLASSPLGQPNALAGLLVAGGNDAPPADLLPLLGVVAGVVTAILQHEGRTTGLQEELQNRLNELARSAAIFETISDGIVVVAPDLTILELNPSAEAILGYASREVTGQPYANILVGVENLVPPFITDLADPLSGPADHNLGNIRLYRRDGRPFLAQVRTVPVVIMGRLASLVILIADLSQEEQFRLRSQQLEQRALLGEVTAVFAHEVRNPINNISTGLQLMSMNLTPEDPNQELIQRLQGDCDRLAELVKSVLAFARPVEYKMEPVDLGASIKRLMERWRPHMARVNVQYSLQIEPETLPTAGDVRALEQVWNNLISNAIQAMEEAGGTLSLKIRPVVTPDGSQRMEVSVLDTGPGIPEEVRERIFEPFYTTKRTGTGLGLAITKHIVTAHKGSISVTSIPGGTVFQVQLPIWDADNRA